MSEKKENQLFTYEYYQQVSDLCYEISGIMAILEDPNLEAFYKKCADNYDEKMKHLTIREASQPIEDFKIKRIDELQQFIQQKRKLMEAK